MVFIIFLVILTMILLLIAGLSLASTDGKLAGTIFSVLGFVILMILVIESSEKARTNYFKPIEVGQEALVVAVFPQDPSKPYGNKVFKVSVGSKYYTEVSSEKLAMVDTVVDVGDTLKMYNVGLVNMSKPLEPQLK